ncbi:11557_t:CDS:2 [Rhizophagus irregularis]|nr:11557_t:CDS:2 [Rhizophagus irregularis]
MSELTEVIITVSLLVGGFLLIFSTYIFGVCNLNILHVLNCKFNYMDIFDAKLSSTAEKKIIHASVISLIIGDIPRFYLLTYINLNSEFSAIPMTSLFLTLLVLFFGFFYRLYESMIRNYENPTIQELVISKKQFSEA